jgi:hypothetical protein
LTWPLRLGTLMDTRAAYPDVNIHEGSTSVDRERIVCRPDGALSYRIETRIIAPDGKLVTRRIYDADAERKKADGAQVLQAILQRHRAVSRNASTAISESKGRAKSLLKYFGTRPLLLLAKRLNTNGMGRPLSTKHIARVRRPFRVHRNFVLKH